MRIGFERGLSERELASRREFRAFCEAENVKQREMEDKQGYEAYLQTLAQEQARVPKAYQITPLSFEEWRKNLPAEEADPTVRGLVGTKNTLTKAHVAHFRDKVANRSLEDEDLLKFGFRLLVRPTDNSEVDLVHLRQAYDSFRALYPDYQHELHFNELSEFINTYNIDPNLHNLECAFAVLWHLRVIEKPEPEPERNPALNECGINLGIEPDPELDRQQARKKYLTDPVIQDPRDGTLYTQYQMDHVVDAETYRRLIIGEHRHPRMSDVIRWDAK